MARHKLTLEELQRAGAVPCPEHLKDSLRQRLIEEMIWLKSSGPKSPEGKARSAANNSGRSAIWSVKTSAQAAIYTRNHPATFIAGVEAALDAAGLPHGKIELKTAYRLGNAGVSCGYVKVFVRGKKAPFDRYGAAIQPYCDGWLSTPGG
jgi:hypothetical protein